MANLNALRDLALRLAPNEANDIAVARNNLTLQKENERKYNNSLNEDEITHIKNGSLIAQTLKATPADQRPAVFSQFKPILQRHSSFDANDEALFQTDQGLDQIINSSKFMMPAEKPLEVAAGNALVNPRTMQEMYRAPEKQNNWANENSLREMQIRAQMDANRATRESTDAYRQAAQSMQQQKMMQDQYNSDRNFDLSKSRIDQQISQQNAAAQKTDRTAQSKLTPLRDAVSVSENTFKQMSDLIQTENFDDAVGFVDQFTAPIGRALFNTKDGGVNRKAAMMTKELAGRIIKEYGSNPSTVDLVQAMQRIPNTGDPDSVWNSWYDEVLTPATQRSKLRLQQEADALGVPAYPQQQAPQSSQQPAQPQQFRSSSGITFQVN